MTIADVDKPSILPLAKELAEMGFKIYATKGTSTTLRDSGWRRPPSTRSREAAAGCPRSDERGEINLVINTPTNNSGARRDGYMMPALGGEMEIPFITTVQAAKATVDAYGGPGRATSIQRT